MVVVVVVGLVAVWQWRIATGDGWVVVYLEGEQTFFVQAEFLFIGSENEDKRASEHFIAK